MGTISRRNFLSQLLVFIASATNLNAIVNAKSPIAQRETDKDSSLVVDECRTVYREWKKRESLSPGDYIVKALSHYQLSDGRISEAAQLDFQNGNFFQVQGLYLSKIEAAVFANIGYESRA